MLSMGCWWKWWDGGFDQDSSFFGHVEQEATVFWCEARIGAVDRWSPFSLVCSCVSYMLLHRVGAGT